MQGMWGSYMNRSMQVLREIKRRSRGPVGASGRNVGFTRYESINIGNR